jgi:hypothetical protein
MPRSVLIFIWLLAQAFSVSAMDALPLISGSNQPVWGVYGGVVWAVPPAQFAAGSPRGLIRIAFPTLPDRGYCLINFIAIEPVVGGQRGYSELEGSKMDGAQGKRIWAEPPNGLILTNHPGGLTNEPPIKKEIEVRLKVEKFDNGAHVGMVIRQRADKPDEVELSVFTEPDSKPMDYCILTATMGNFARARQLWLNDGVVSSLQLFPDYKKAGFAAMRHYPSSRLRRTADGRLMAAITNDEEDPASVHPFPGKEWWYYGGFKVTQYWAKPGGSSGDDLRVAVNGRYTYWQSQQPVPGGIAFENFELNEHFSEGQKFIFGITRQTPHELGF